MPVTLSEFKSNFYGKLSSFYGEPEIGAMYRLLLEHALGLDAIQLALNAQMILKETDYYKLDIALKRLSQSEPIQYVLGEAHFFELKFKVKEGILIPRQETEILIQSILNHIKGKVKNPKILDVGTGSGCIAITLQKNIEGSSVYAIDISDTALEVAKENAQYNKSAVLFKKLNILYPTTDIDDQQFDVIASNPPYVLESEKKLMHRNVIDFEPDLALYVQDEDPLVYYDAIISFSTTHLVKNGILAFEINEKFGHEIKKRMEKNGFSNVEIVKDLNNKDRVVLGEKR